MKLFFAVTALGLMIGLSGCTEEREEFHVDTTNHQAEEAQIRVISQSDIPEGIQPMAFESKTELDDFINEINNIEFETSRALAVSVTRIKTRTEGGSAGTKSITADLDSKGEYQILIDLTYARKGEGEIQVASKNVNTWVFSSWTQDTGVASWLGTSSIQYALTGTVKWYVILELEFIEVSRRSFSVSGTEQV